MSNERKHRLVLDEEEVDNLDIFSDDPDDDSPFNDGDDLDADGSYLFGNDIDDEGDDVSEEAIGESRIRDKKIDPAVIQTFMRGNIDELKNSVKQANKQNEIERHEYLEEKKRQKALEAENRKQEDGLFDEIEEDVVEAVNIDPLTIGSDIFGGDLQWERFTDVVTENRVRKIANHMFRVVPSYKDAEQTILNNGGNPLDYVVLKKLSGNERNESFSSIKDWIQENGIHLDESKTNVKLPYSHYSAKISVGITDDATYFYVNEKGHGNHEYIYAWPFGRLDMERKLKEKKPNMSYEAVEETIKLQILSADLSVDVEQGINAGLANMDNIIVASNSVDIFMCLDDVSNEVRTYYKRNVDKKKGSVSFARTLNFNDNGSMENKIKSPDNLYDITCRTDGNVFLSKTVTIQGSIGDVPVSFQGCSPIMAEKILRTLPSIDTMVQEKQPKNRTNVDDNNPDNDEEVRETPQIDCYHIFLGLMKENGYELNSMNEFVTIRNNNDNVNAPVTLEGDGDNNHVAMEIHI